MNEAARRDSNAALIVLVGVACPLISILLVWGDASITEALHRGESPLFLKYCVHLLCVLCPGALLLFMGRWAHEGRWPVLLAFGLGFAVYAVMAAFGVFAIPAHDEGFVLELLMAGYASAFLYVGVRMVRMQFIGQK